MDHSKKTFPLVIFLGVTVFALTFAGCKKDAFSKTDLDRIGTLSKQETSLVLLESIYSLSDANGDARITFIEWKTVNPDAKTTINLRRSI